MDKFDVCHGRIVEIKWLFYFVCHGRIVEIKFTFLSLQLFDMIKDKTYGLFKTYFYSYNTFPADNLLILRPLKVLPCYLKVASG